MSLWIRHFCWQRRSQKYLNFAILWNAVWAVCSLWRGSVLLAADRTCTVCLLIRGVSVSATAYSHSRHPPTPPVTPIMFGDTIKRTVCRVASVSCMVHKWHAAVSDKISTENSWFIIVKEMLDSKVLRCGSVAECNSFRERYWHRGRWRPCVPVWQRLEVRD
jgi:hypothetical protein